jgi:osmotically-inducible protein OsmY
VTVKSPGGNLSILEAAADVIAELSWEPSVNAAHIGVEVANGVVTLAGHVNSYTEKVNAERATQRVAGVKALAVEMDVKIAGATAKRTDADIAQSVESVLQWATYFPSDSIKVKAEGGWITLSGEVEWDYQRQTAIDSVRHLAGEKFRLEVTLNSIGDGVMSTDIRGDVSYLNTVAEGLTGWSLAQAVGHRTWRSTTASRICRTESC